MQYKNPVDIELVNASQEAYDMLARLCEFLGTNVDYGMPLRLKNAVANARAEMNTLEQADATDFVNTTEPPTSND